MTVIEKQIFGGLKPILETLYDGVYILDRNRKISFWNKSAESLTGYKESEVLGKRCSDNILMHVDKYGNPLCRSSCPMQATLMDGEFRESEVYLHHKEGHRVPVVIRSTPLENGHGERIGVVEVFNDNSANDAVKEENEYLRRMALFDDLTQVGNRRYTEERLNEIFNESTRYSWPFGVLFLDIDHFKKINDRHGHHAGDVVLKQVAQTLKNGTRSFDLTGRWGGEEFVCIIKHVEKEQLWKVAEKLRSLVESLKIKIENKVLRVTISVGGALTSDGDQVKDLIRRADVAMYESKKNGRNRTSIVDRTVYVSSLEPIWFSPTAC